MLKIEYVSKKAPVDVPIVPLGVYRKGDDLWMLHRDIGSTGDFEFILVPLSRDIDSNRTLNEGYDESTWMTHSALQRCLDELGFDYLPNVRLIVEE